MEAFERVLREYVDSGAAVGASARIVHRGRELYRGAAGFASAEEGRPFTCESSVRVFSMTKLITAVAAMRLYEQGAFYLDQPVHHFVPAFRETKVLSYRNGDVPQVRQSSGVVTMRHIFTMTAGFAYPAIAVMSNTPRRYVDGGHYTAKAFAALKAEEAAGTPLTTRRVLDAIADIPMCFEPGEGWIYGLSADILAGVVSVISGKSVDDFMRDEIFKPLGMTRTSFCPTAEQLVNPAVVYNYRDPAKPVPFDFSRDLVSSVSGAATKELHICVGGLTSTLDDFSRFMQMIANGGTLDGARILGRKTVELMASDHLNEVQYNDFKSTWFPRGYATWGLMGRVSKTVNQATLPLFPGSYGWSGAAGTVAAADPGEGLSVVFMTQRLPSDSAAVIAKLIQIAYGAID